MEAAFRVFTERSIESVTMTEVAKAAGVGVVTIYRHYVSKPRLVVAVGAWAWERYITANNRMMPRGGTGADELRFYLDSFLDLYRRHADLLRFNQLFNVYVRGENIPFDEMLPYTSTIRALIEQFHGTYAKGRADGTINSRMTEREMLAALIHLMLAAVTRYAIGLVFTEGSDPERELMLLRDMLLREFTE